MAEETANGPENKGKQKDARNDASDTEQSGIDTTVGNAVATMAALTGFTNPTEAQEVAPTLAENLIVGPDDAGRQDGNPDRVAPSNVAPSEAELRDVVEEPYTVPVVELSTEAPTATQSVRASPLDDEPEIGIDGRSLRREAESESSIVNSAETAPHSSYEQLETGETTDDSQAQNIVVPEEDEAQPNVPATDITFASGGSVDESVTSGGSIDIANDPSGDIVAKLAATGGSGGTHTYSITNDASGKFEIIGDEIRVKAGQTIDYETDSSFDITVQSTDQFGGTLDKVMTITVDDYEGGYLAGDSGETVTGTSEEDSITGGNGNDTIYGGAGNDTITGGAGNDTITGGAGDDSLTGGAGIDRFMAGEGADSVDGGDDWDWMDYSAAGESVSIDLLDQSNNAGAAAGDTYTNIEAYGGTAFDDTFVGSEGYEEFFASAGDDTISGNGGSDYLFGGDGVDTIDGGTGNDYIRGDVGDDTLDGGEGTDQAVWAGNRVDFTISYNSGTDTFTVVDQNAADTDEGTDRLVNFENFTFNGTTYTKAEMITEADRQANTAPDLVAVASGGDVDENAATGTVVATLQASDVDGDTLTYEITDAGGDSDSR